MIYWCLSIVFFVITFGPRFFTLMNFGYGFLDLGLYCQVVGDFGQGFINPYIPVLRNTFLTLLPEPLVILLWPLSQFLRHPTVFLFLDEVAVVVTAAVVANSVQRKTSSKEATVAAFISVLFSPLLFRNLHSPANFEIWALPFFTLLITELLSKRRPEWLILWSVLLCASHLNFYPMAFLVSGLCLLTQVKRWNLKRRFESALGVFVVGVVSAVSLHALHGQTYFNFHALFQHFGPTGIQWLICFLFLPILLPEALLIMAFILMVQPGGRPLELSLLVPLGPVCGIIVLKRFNLTSRPFLTVWSAAVISLTVYFNLMGADPFFHFWVPERWAISEYNKKVHDMIDRVHPLESIAVSEVYTPFLGDHMTMTTLTTTDWVVRPPENVLTHNEPFTDRRYKEIERQQQTGARLFGKIK